MCSRTGIIILILVFSVLVTGEDVNKQSQSNGKTPSILFLGAHVEERQPGKPNKYALRSIIPDARFQDKMKEWGYKWTVDFLTTQLTLDYLKQFNTVVMLDFPMIEKTPLIKDKVRKIEDLLKEYVKEGGGLLLTGLTEYGMWGLERDTEELNRFLAPLDAKVCSEQVGEKNQLLKLPKQNPNAPSALAWAGNITPHPVTTGVKGILYPTEYAWGYYTHPVKTGNTWQVLIKCSPTAYSYTSRLGAGGSSGEKDKKNPGTYKSEPPLLAVRDYGKGRIVLWPTVPTTTIIDGYHPFWGRGLIMNPKKGTLPSSGETLLHNIFNWLSEPTKNIFGGYVPPAKTNEEKVAGLHRVDWSKIRYKKDFQEYPHIFKGIIGLKSTLSTGSSTPEEMLKAAKDAGYKFAAFSEDLAKLTKEKLDELNKICVKCTDSGFEAFSGFIYQDASGNKWQVFGKELQWPKDDWWYDREKKIILKNNMIFRGYRSCPVILVHPNKNPELPWFQGNFKGISVYTYKNGKLIDNATQIYEKLQADNFMLFPVVVNIVESTAEVKKAAASSELQTYVPWFELADVLNAVGGNFSKYKSRYVFQRTPFISSGPIFEAYLVYNFGTSDLAIPGGDRFRMFLNITAEKGLKEVTVLDRQKLWRRFLLSGEKQWSIHLDGYHDKNHNFIVIATDNAGGIAVSCDRWTNVQELNVPRCTDNLNTYHSGKYKAQGIFAVRGLESYVDRQAGNFHRFVPIPGLKETTRPAVDQQLDLVSRFGYIKTDVLDCYYAETSHGNWNCNDQPELAHSQDKFKRKSTVTLFTPWAGSTSVYIVEGEFEALKKLKIPKNQIKIFTGNWVKYADTYVVSYKDGRCFCESLKPWAPKSSDSSLDNAFYVANLGAIGGSRALIPMSKNLNYISMVGGRVDDPGYYLAAYYRTPKPELEAGEKVSYKYLSVWSQMQAIPRNDFVEDIVNKMGIRNGKTAYQVIAEKGKVLDKKFVLLLQAENYGFTGKITQAKLPMRLPVFIEGLNSRWPAGIWYKGKNQLFIPEWIMNRVHNRYSRKKKITAVNTIYRFGILKNQGMLQIDTEIGDKNVFIGNLLVCDNPDLFLELEAACPGQERIAVNNPTDKSVTTIVKPGPGFTLFGDFSKKITVPAGGYTTIKIK